MFFLFFFFFFFNDTATTEIYTLSLHDALPNFPQLTELKLPQTTNTLKNFGGERCGGTLALSFQKSCNTTFGQIGLDLGNEFVPGMEKFGIGSAPPLDVAPGAADSVGP